MIIKSLVFVYIIIDSRNSGNKLFVNLKSLFVQKAKAIYVITIFKLIHFFLMLRFKLCFLADLCLWWSFKSLMRMTIINLHNQLPKISWLWKLFHHVFSAIVCGQQPVGILAGYFREKSHLLRVKKWLKHVTTVKNSLLLSF